MAGGKEADMNTFCQKIFQDLEANGAFLTPEEIFTFNSSLNKCHGHGHHASCNHVQLCKNWSCCGIGPLSGIFLKPENVTALNAPPTEQRHESCRIRVC